MFEYQFRLIVVGDSTVGKSSLLRYFCDGKFCDDSDPTVGVDFYARIIEIRPGYRVKLQIWDTAGQERFRSITRSYYRNCVGALLLYDITNNDSFEHVAGWLNEARKQIEPNNAVFLLVGTKKDKEHLREVPHEQAQQFADYHNMLFIETSSKTGLNVENAFKQLACEISQMLDDGKFKIQEGWDGIKSGYARPQNHINQSPNQRVQVSSTSQQQTSSSTTTATAHDTQKRSCC